MPKIIFTSRYIKNPARVNAGKLIRYMGTREGVEKLPTGIDNSPATKKQNDLICVALKTVPESWDYPEMKAYLENKTKSNATEFLNEFLERNADRIDGVKKLVSYYAERPSVEKIGKHGLFSQTDDKIDLDSVAEEISNHQRILWTHVVSLRREDAERLGYNNAEAWKNLVRRNVIAIAETHKIKVSDLQWYAAFHNTTHHPHIHLMVYSKDEKQGYLTKKAIEDMRSVFGNDIFRNEQYKLFKMETQQRDLIKDKVTELLNKLENQYEVSPKMKELFLELIEQLKTYEGKKVYGYLPKNIKETVNKIVSEFAKDKNIAELYKEWNKINREKLSLYYDKEKPDILLEDNKEFRSIKNVIIKTAVMVDSQNEDVTPEQNVNSLLVGVLKSLLKLISKSYQKKVNNLNSQVDSKLKSKIEQKKMAHGLKTDKTANQNDEQNYTMSM